MSTTFTVPAATCSMTNVPSGAIGVMELGPKEAPLRRENTLTPPVTAVPSRRRARPSIRPPCRRAMRTSGGSLAGSTSAVARPSAKEGWRAMAWMGPLATPRISKRPPASVTASGEDAGPPIANCRPLTPCTVTTAAGTGAPAASTTLPRTIPPAPRATRPTSVAAPAETFTFATVEGARSGALISTT